MKTLHKWWILFLLGGTTLARGEHPDNSALGYYLAFPRIDLPATFSTNPAWLQLELKEQVAYRCDLITASGRWHLPYEPGRRTNFIPYATGTRTFSENHIFTGTFGYRYQLQTDKLWVHNQAPYNGNPFLFGDSTLGGFQLRGLFWEVGYGNQLGRQWHSGIALFYNVDEEYKTVFPKSQVKHRDLALRIGAGYHGAKGNRCGLSLSYFDFQEIMETSQYTLEQDKSPIFIKIRATDNPLLTYGQTSEERLFAIQGFNLGLDGRWQYMRPILTYHLNAERVQAQNVDGGAYPIKQGRWHVQRIYYQAILENRLGRSSGVKVFSAGSLTEQWGQHPEINQKIYTFRTRQITGGASWYWFLGKHWVAIPTLFYTSATYKRTDLYNGNLQYFPQHSLGFQQQFALNVQTRTRVELTAGFKRYTAESELFSERQDWYYQQITVREIEYYESATTTWWGELSLRILSSPQRYGLVGRLRYAIDQPTDKTTNTRREHLIFNLSLEH